MADISNLLGAGGWQLGGAIGRAVVNLELDTAKYNAELEAAHAKTAASTTGMQSSVSKYAGLAKAAFLGVGLAAVAGVAIAIKAGSDLNEQVNKAGEVFEGSAKKAIDFSKAAASGLGIAEAEALEATSNFGQLLEAAGFAADAAEGMSEKMTTLGADLGSFNNIPVAEALEKIRAGLAGQARPLREVGVFLSEARVEAEAYSSGIAEVGAELTDAQKIQARYNIILDDTAKAQGDFQRTVGESLPNQLKVLQAELINTAADLGIVLLPVVLDVVKAFHVVVPLLQFAAEHLDLVVAALLGFGAVKYIPGLINAIAVATVRMTAAMGASLTAQGNISAFFGTAAALAPPLIAGLVGIGYAIKQMGDIAAETDRQVAGLTQRLAEGKIGVDAYRASVVEAEVGTGVFAGRLPKVTQEAKEVAEAGLETAYAIGRMGMAEGEAAALADELAHSHNVAGKAVKNFAHMTDDELEKWSGDIKESIDTGIFALQDLSTDSGITRADIQRAFRDMREEAQNWSSAMRTLSHEHWLNDEFIKFLSEQGPEWTIAFADLTEIQQRRAQTAWEQSTNKVDAGKQSLDKIIGVLKDLDGGTSKHTVIIDYRYEGFDPTKPGMSAQGVGQQR